MDYFYQKGYFLIKGVFRRSNELSHLLPYNIPPYDRKPRGEVKTPLKQDFYLSE